MLANRPHSESFFVCNDLSLNSNLSLTYSLYGDLHNDEVHSTPATVPTEIPQQNSYLLSFFLIIFTDLDVTVPTYKN